MPVDDRIESSHPPQRGLVILKLNCLPLSAQRCYGVLLVTSIFRYY